MIVASPITTRLYSPRDFGTLAVFMSVLGIVTTVASLRYERAILLPATDSEASSLLRICFAAILITAGITTIATWFFGSQAYTALNTPELVTYQWLVPIALTLTGIYQVMYHWALRQKRFKAIALTRIEQATAMNGVQVGGHAFGSISLLVGQIAGQAVGILALSKGARSTAGVKHHESLRRVAHRYRHFPYFDSWTGLANATSVQMTPLFVANLFGASSAGLFALAYRVTALPLSLVGTAIANVFFAAAAEGDSRENLGPTVRKLHRALALLAMPPSLILLIAGPDLFALAFGSAWSDAGEMARWLAPWLYAALAASPLTPVLTVLERQSEAASFQVLLLGGRIGALAVGGILGGVYLSIALYSCVSVVILYVLLARIFIVSGCTVSELFASAGKASLLSGLTCAPLALSRIVEGPWGVQMIGWVATALLVSWHYYRLYREQ